MGTKESELIKGRREKVKAIRDRGVNPYSNKFSVNTTSFELKKDYGELSAEELKKVSNKWSLAGRIISKRVFGKASFFHIQDRKGKIQAYIQKEEVGDEEYKFFKTLDIGDIVGIEGTLFKTKTGELTINVLSLTLLTKSILPLPEKWHGLRDVELRYRQRYVDLIVNPSVKEVFIKRTRIIQLIREFFNDRDFLEVETPMMHPIPGGATARPFKTYHNTLHIDLYLRIAPELYLKRLVVGGLERVYEINRNFRNEGISVQHNPEFTMLEFYQSYSTYEDLMELTEELFAYIAKNLMGKLKFNYQGKEIDLSPPWKRYKVVDALKDIGGVESEIIMDRNKAFDYAKKLDIEVDNSMGKGKILMEIFEKVVEEKLIQPTFITMYPTEVSPLSKRNDEDPDVVDRFELFIAGREIANGFSELTDPEDQKARFLKQLKDKEIEEVGKIDEDFIRALEYGMPPTAGEGIGIDRMVMLFTDSPSIRDVIFFPQLRPEK